MEALKGQQKLKPDLDVPGERFLAAVPPGDLDGTGRVERLCVEDHAVHVEHDVTHGSEHFCLEHRNV